MRNHPLFTTMMGTALLLIATASQGASIRIEQTWLSTGFATNGRLINTTSIVDADSITGVGIEDAPLLLLNMSVFQNGIGQNFNRANFTDPPNLTDEGNSGARFEDGVFKNLFNVNNGGAARVGLKNGNAPFGSAGGYAVGANNAAGTFEFIWFFPVSGQEEFLLDQTQTIVTFPQAVPLPGAFGFLVFGLGWLVIRGSSRAPLDLKVILSG